MQNKAAIAAQFQAIQVNKSTSKSANAAFKAAQAG
jgi:hypothetical protein